MINQDSATTRDKIHKGGRGKSIIVEKGLEDAVTNDLLSGLGSRAIAAKYGLSRGCVRSFSEKVKQTSPPAGGTVSQAVMPAPSNPPFATRGPDAVSPAVERNQALVQLTAEVARLKLGKLLQECEANYDQALQEGNQVLAGSWAVQWGAAIDKLLKATGVYQRASREAQSAEVEQKPVEIRITHVRATLEEPRPTLTEFPEADKKEEAPKPSLAQFSQADKKAQPEPIDTLKEASKPMVGEFIWGFPRFPT